MLSTHTSNKRSFKTCKSGLGFSTMILVTGASGLLGSNLILAGAKTGRVMGAVSNRHAVRWLGVKYWQVDLTNTREARRILRLAAPKVIIHCAAETNLDSAEKDPSGTKRINVDATANLATIAAELGAKFVYISTDAVFDGSRSWNRETDRVHPLNVYAKTKYQAELLAAEKNPGTIIARINIYGWNALPKQSLAEWMLGNLEKGQAFSGFDDVFFCPMLTNDLSDILFEMLDRGLEGTYHVTGSERISKYEFGVKLARCFGLDESLVIPSSVKSSALVAQRALDISLSTEKITGVLGHRTANAEEGLQRFKMLRSNGFRNELKAMIEEQS